MFWGRDKKQSDRATLRPVPAPAPAREGSLPDVPSLEGYTIDELRTEQLAHLIRFDELEPEQVQHLIRALTRGHG